MKIKFLPGQVIVYEPKQPLTKKPKVSIIVVNWNGKHLITKCLNSCFNQAYADIEIIVVDNNSSDDSLRHLIANYPQITTVRNQVNAGFGQAANIGVSLAKGDYVLFLNNDAWLHPLATKNLVETVTRNPKIKVAGPLILNSNGSVQNFNFKISWLASNFAQAKTETIDKNKLASVFYVPGCAFFVEKAFFQQLGSFDPTYFLYYEDVDFCWRARLQGAEVVLCPWAIAYHYGGASKANLFLHKIYEQDYSLEAEEAFYHWRNRLRLIIKNASLELAVFGSFLIALNLFLKSLTALVKWKKNLASQYLRAVSWNLKMLPNLLRERRKIQTKRVLPDKEVLEQTMVFQLDNYKQKIS